jgi:hypothetical protein
MGRPKKKLRRMVTVSKKVSLKKKSGATSDTVKVAPTRLSGDNGANFRVKVTRRRR